ncbi:protein argonaute 2-like [Arachis stenosperma]|uniref:protein argonaute 2-like n=1 Tax=Arachis stenosperma TaxID=217475 RepID=UPI0025AD139F|nr:protein argonaute 2-like [Arachis stenosperma]
MDRGGYNQRRGGGNARGYGGGGRGRGRNFPQPPRQPADSGAGRGVNPQPPPPELQPRQPSTITFGSFTAGSRTAQTKLVSPPSEPHPQPPPPQLQPRQPSTIVFGSFTATSSRSAPPNTVSPPSKPHPPSRQDSSETISPVRRPDHGGREAFGKRTLLVNHFLVEFNPNKSIMQYHVEVSPQSQPQPGLPPRRISKTELSLIRDKLLDHPEVPSGMIAYDGERSIFSMVPLPEALVVEVSKGENEKLTGFNVTLTLVKNLEMSRLDDYIRGRELSIPHEILHGLNVVFKKNPTKCTVPVGGCFYPLAPKVRETNLEPGVIAVGGFRHSLKLTQQGLSLCLDSSVLSFKKQMSVLDFLEKQITGFNLREFGKYRKTVEKLLIGLKVQVNHRKNTQKYSVAGLTEKDTRQTIFSVADAQGNPTIQLSLVDFFKDKYQIVIKNEDIPALVFGGNRTRYVPMELCHLAEGQMHPRQYLSRQAAKALRNLCLPLPPARQARIMEMVKSSCGPCGGDIVANFGMSVSNAMTKVAGRVLRPPDLKLRDPTGRTSLVKLTPEKCKWNLYGKSMVEGKLVDRWGILDFTTRSNRVFNSDSFIAKLTKQYNNFGITMKKPVLTRKTEMWKLSNYNQLYDLLEKINSEVSKSYKRPLQFLPCVLAYKDPGYKCLKWIAETKVGIVTQCCVLGSTSFGSDQYLSYLALKINAKIGGSNVELMNRLPYFEGNRHVMFIGADVNHPNTRDANSRSVAAVVATVNWPAANRYAARLCAQGCQGTRTEKILNFGKDCFELVSYYEMLNGAKPEKIVIFRDGVSDSQFQMVLGEELQDLKKTFKRANYSPTITLIVAQKRHQTRLFPSYATGDNVLPGTVVDTVIVHPFEFDFYLVSHSGGLGTSKAVHYFVLWDEHNFTSDKLQKLIYDMCFTFARCMTPVSLVPPVYYADLAAYRGQQYYEAKVQMQSRSATSSSSSALASSSVSSATSNLNDMDFCKLHSDLENIMFFI